MSQHLHKAQQAYLEKDWEKCHKHLANLNEAESTNLAEYRELLWESHRVNNPRLAAAQTEFDKRIYYEGVLLTNRSITGKIKIVPCYQPQRAAANLLKFGGRAALLQILSDWHIHNKLKGETPESEQIIDELFKKNRETICKKLQSGRYRHIPATYQIATTLISRTGTLPQWAEWVAQLTTPNRHYYQQAHITGEKDLIPLIYKNKPLAILKCGSLWETVAKHFKNRPGLLALQKARKEQGTTQPLKINKDIVEQLLAWTSPKHLLEIGCAQESIEAGQKQRTKKLLEGSTIKFAGELWQGDPWIIWNETGTQARLTNQTNMVIWLRHTGQRNSNELEEIIHNEQCKTYCTNCPNLNKVLQTPKSTCQKFQEIIGIIIQKDLQPCHNAINVQNKIVDFLAELPLEIIQPIIDNHQYLLKSLEFMWLNDQKHGNRQGTEHLLILLKTLLKTRYKAEPETLGQLL